MNTKFIKTFLLLCMISFVFHVYASESIGTINSSNKYAWGENMGWVNFAPQNGSTYIGLTITDTAITGYAWNDQFGWINFSPTNSGQGVSNNTDGHLGGQAWVASLGWLDMSGVSINASGKFIGTAGVQNSDVGRISFDCTNCNVTTDWRPLASRTVTPPSNPSGGGGGSVGYNNPLSIPNTTPATPNNVNYIPKICEPFVDGYIKLGAKNDIDEVKKLQSFLNTYEKEKLVVDGIYKQVDFDAVKRFQSKHTDILEFWNLTKPTGYVYIATQKSINRVYCEQTMKLSCPYFSTYVKQNETNVEVKKIRKFLNETQGEKLDLNSNLYDDILAGAVKRFQIKYKNQVLTPWGLTKASGRWYQSTKKKADEILGCYAPVRLDNGKVLE